MEESMEAANPQVYSIDGEHGLQSSPAKPPRQHQPGRPSMPLPPPPYVMPMMDKASGQYHPDFMFCGSCSTCQDPDPTRADRNPNDVVTAEEELMESQHQEEDDDEINARGEDAVIIRSKFNLLQPITCPSHVLVIQSLIKPLPGVVKVIVPQAGKAPGDEEYSNTQQLQQTDAKQRLSYNHNPGPAAPKQIIVDHDARTMPETILSALDNVGHKAQLQANQAPSQGNDPLVVRSQFAVRGVCCASEVPIVRKIVLPLNGVSKVQINLTTKCVYVQHDINRISAQQVADAMSKEGFPSVVKKDGAKAVAAQRRAMNHGRTSLHVQAVLTEQDVAPIQRYLSRIPGVSRIGINVSESVVYVDHDVVEVSSIKCVEQLKQAGYETKVAVAAEEKYQRIQRLSLEQGSGAVVTNGQMSAAAAAETVAALENIGRSKYVESTITIEKMEARHVNLVRKAISQNFIRAQVRAVYPNILSHTIKLEHDPDLVSVLDVCHTLDSYPKLPSPAIVTVNGANLNLYLPSQDDRFSAAVDGAGGIVEPDGLDQLGIQNIRLNVILSGVFWFISILSLKGGAWEYLEYAGLLSVLFGLPPIVAKAFRTARRCQLDANCMMVTAALGALVLQEYDEAASVAFLFAVSEFLEARATLKARRALSAICSLRPDHANVIHPLTKELIIVPADRVPLGSLLSIKTGDKIATDGVVVEGNSAVDESSLTGESKPVHKQVGDTVSGGTINIGATQLVVRTATTAEDSAVARLIRLVEEAQSNRSPTEKMIDTFARSYTPVVVLLAAIMCTIPWAWGSETGRYWTLNGLIIIVIACPCALTISTPVTYAAGLAATAQRGIIVKGGANLEAMGSVDKIVFDKTGTLTQGKFTVVHLEVIGTTKTRTEMLELLALLQGRSSHPLSASLVAAAKREGINMPTHMSVANHSILKGEGVTAKIDGVCVYAGNQRLFGRLGWLDSLSLTHKDLIANWGATGGTVGLLGTASDGIIGAFCVKDSVRDEARSVLREVSDAGIEIIMCTGDSDSAAHSVARELGIPRGGVHSQLLPEDKLHFVGSLKRPQPKSFAVCRDKKYVMFIGDGVNDAPALAVADVGVSMGEGAAMAMEMSDVTLMDSNLTKLPYVIHMGRRVMSTVRENIIASLIAKLVIVGLTFLGKMTLLMAIAADVGIMLAVTLNGMKLLPGRADLNVNFSSEEAEITDAIRILAPINSRRKKYSSVPRTMPDEASSGGAKSVTLGEGPLEPSIELISSQAPSGAEIV